MGVEDGVDAGLVYGFVVLGDLVAAGQFFGFEQPATRDLALVDVGQRRVVALLELVLAGLGLDAAQAQRQALVLVERPVHRERLAGADGGFERPDRAADDASAVGDHLDREIHLAVGEGGGCVDDDGLGGLGRQRFPGAGQRDQALAGA